MAVYRHRHFAKAAEQCNVTQPTLSAMVQKLEDELGVKIFDRTTQPVTPTRIGRLVIEQGWKTLVKARKIKELVAEEKQSTPGAYTFGILPTIAPQLTAAHPEMELRIVEMKTDDIKRALARGEMDAAILVNLDDMENFTKTTLFYEQFIAYVSRNDTLYNNKMIRTADLNNEFLWMLDEGHCFRDQLVKFCDLKSARATKYTYTLGSIETFMRMVENGKGITFIPELALEQLSERQRELVRPFAIPIPTREIILMTSKNFVRHAILSLLEKTIKEGVPEKMLELNNTEQRI